MTEEWLKGYQAALADYAWWKDGTLYVGCGVLTLKDARGKIQLLYNLEKEKELEALPDKLKCDYCGTMVLRGELGGHENWCREEAK